MRSKIEDRELKGTDPFISKGTTTPGPAGAPLRIHWLRIRFLKNSSGEVVVPRGALK